MARKSSASSGVAIGALVVLGLLAQAIQSYWPYLLVLGVAALAYWILKPSQRSLSSQQHSPPVTLKVAVESPPRAVQREIVYPAGKPIIQDGDTLWLAAGKTATVAGYTIDGRFLYVGKGLVGGNGYRTEAALIDPTLLVNLGNEYYTIRKLDYWASYSEASPEARASYLNWLATGRADLRADIGYVFLYFYGLERRVLVDAVHSENAKAELPAIMQEIERLLTIYGSNHSFRRYAGSLLDLLRGGMPTTACQDTPPPLSPAGELGFVHRLCLGQISQAHKPLPGEWAYLWMMSDPTTRLRTAAQRCPEEFKRAFLEQYELDYRDGLVLPKNKTRLKVTHRPASPSLQGVSHLEKSLDLPDVSVLSSPVKKLQTIAETCMSKLDSYSRFLGRNPDKAGTADALLELPFNLWPEQYREPIKRLSTTIKAADKPMAIKFEKLAALLPDWPDEKSERRYRNLARVLSETGLGIEPDLNFRGKMPVATSTVVLFPDDAIRSYGHFPVEYDAAVLSLHLAVAVSMADGSVDESEKQLLLRQLENWLHLNKSARLRLKAHLRLLITEPPGLNNIKKRLEALSQTARQAIGEFLAEVAKADNEVTPAEVKLLEQIFKMFDLDVQTLYGMLHIALETPVTVRPAGAHSLGFTIPSPPKAKEAGVELDMNRIAALHAESEKVSAILSAIFADDVPQSEPLPEPQDIETVVEDSVMGLDAEYTALVRQLCTRQEWRREELEELAQDRGIMLDGALEHINEAAFDLYDQPFCEGDDPVEINQEIVKEILP